MKSMDDLPDVDQSYVFRVELAEILFPVPSDEGYEIRFARAPELPHWRWGVLFRWGSVWIGAHWSRRNRRICINLIPFVTIWVTAPGGVAP